MLNRQDLGVLIVGYQRPDSIRQILEQCSSNGIKRVYLSIDAPKDSSQTSYEKNVEIKQICADFETEFDLVSQRFLLSNVGCSANLLSACDWVFEHEEFVAILEDDCIPSAAFFEFVIDALPSVDSEEELVLVCGTQFAPPSVVGSAPYKSKYSLTWGWATSIKKWDWIKSQLAAKASQSVPKKLFSLNSEEIYWMEGARRAFQGYVDVWDTALVMSLIFKNRFAILPNQNLVTNVGNDAVATHTGGDRKWLHEPVGNYSSGDLKVYPRNPDADAWLKNNFYRIRFRHLFSTRITRFFDFVKREKRTSLIQRWFSARKQ